MERPPGSTIPPYPKAERGDCVKMAVTVILTGVIVGGMEKASHSLPPYFIQTVHKDCYSQKLVKLEKSLP